MSTFTEYKLALASADDEIKVVIMDRAADDFDLSLAEFLELIQFVNQLFLCAGSPDQAMGCSSCGKLSGTMSDRSDALRSSFP